MGVLQAFKTIFQMVSSLRSAFFQKVKSPHALHPKKKKKK